MFFLILHLYLVWLPPCGRLEIASSGSASFSGFILGDWRSFLAIVPVRLGENHKPRLEFGTSHLRAPNSGLGCIAPADRITGTAGENKRALASSREQSGPPEALPENRRNGKALKMGIVRLQAVKQARQAEELPMSLESLAGIMPFPGITHPHGHTGGHDSLV